MRVLTGSVLALLVGGVAYMNLTTPPPGEQVGQGRAVERDPEQAPAARTAPDAAAGAATAQGAGAEEASRDESLAIVPLRSGSGDEQAALDRISLAGPGLERSSAALEDFDPIRDRARTAGAEASVSSAAPAPSEGDAVLTDLLGVGRPRGGEAPAAPDALALGSGAVGDGATDSEANGTEAIGAGAIGAGAIGAGAIGAGAVGTVAVVVSDTAGAPIAGVTVMVVPQGETTELARGTSDAAGRVALAGLEPGLLQLLVPGDALAGEWLAPWYADLCRGAATPAGIGTPCFVVLADGSSQPQVLTLVRAGRLEGEVFGRDGGPASDALVRVVYDAPGYEACRAIAQTDAAGRYGFDLVPGKYRMEVAFRSDGPNGGVAPFEAKSLVVLEGERTRMAPLRAAAVVAAAPTDAEAPVSAAQAEASQPAVREVAAPQRPARAEGGFIELELYGRVVSNFGEPLADVEVILQERDSQERRASARTDRNGEWKASGVTGKALLAVARGERLLASSEPVAVSAQDGQRRVRVQDLVVEVRRVFQLRGQIVVSAAELVTFRDELLARVGEAVPLTDEHVRRAYMRGLRLEQRAVGARHGRTVAILDDGTFSWSCALPADDVEFVLESRGMRTGGRAARTRLVVTPAGDRTLEVQLPFPAETKAQIVADEAHPRS